MLNGGEIIQLKGRYFLFCGFEKNAVMHDIHSHINEEYYTISKLSNNEKMLQGALNAMLFQSVKLLELNENLELDLGSVTRNGLFLNIFDDTIVVKIVDLQETLTTWQLKKQLLDSNTNELPELLTTEEVLVIIADKETKEEYIPVLKKKIIREFFLDVIQLYKGTVYYEQVANAFSRYIDEAHPIKFTRNCHVFRNDSLKQFYFFVQLNSEMKLYAVTSIDDIVGTVHALAERGKFFSKYEQLETIRIF